VTARSPQKLVTAAVADRLGSMGHVALAGSYFEAFVED
jgi:hypothetical protein